MMETRLRAREPEVELLLLTVARATGAPVEPDLAGAAESVRDWERFEGLAERHEVAPMVAGSLRSCDGDPAPADVLARLWEERRRVARRNLYLANECRSVLDALEGSGIQCRVLKGIPLGIQALGDAGIRPTADLDLFLRKEDLERATAVLLELGYYAEESLAPSAQKAKERDVYSRTFGRREGWVGLDVHWAFAPRRFGETRMLEDVWSTGDQVSAYGHEFPVLSWPHLPVHLAIHGSKHGPIPWPKLKWIADVSGLLVRRGPEEWREALSYAAEIGCRRRLLLAVAMAERCLDAPVDPHLRRALDSEPKVLDVAEELESYLFSRDGALPGAVGRVRMDANLRDRPTERAAIVARSVLLPSKKEWGRVTLPRTLSWLYGPMRAGRLIWRYLLHPWRIPRVFGSRSRPDSD